MVLVRKQCLLLRGDVTEQKTTGKFGRCIF